MYFRVNLDLAQNFVVACSPLAALYLKTLVRDLTQLLKCILDYFAS